MSILEARIPFQHKVWQEGTTRDSHGNKVAGFSPTLIDRLAIDVYPMNSSVGRSDYISPDVVARTETDVMLGVDDASVFGAQDQIILFGVTFKVQGQPQFSTWDYMPIDGYADLVPDVLHVKRVT